jgi:hypothetical protein
MTARWVWMPLPKIPPALTESEVDRRIEQWHTSDTGGYELHEWLGWTERQYAAWMERGVIPVVR